MRRDRAIIVRHLIGKLNALSVESDNMGGTARNIAAILAGRRVAFLSTMRRRIDLGLHRAVADPHVHQDCRSQVVKLLR